MLTNDKQQLLIFDNFIVDRKLPKYNRKKLTSNDVSDSGTAVFGNSSDFEGWNVANPSELVINAVSDENSNKKGLFYTFFNKFKKKPKQPKQPKFELSISEFFYSIKNSTKEIRDIQNRSEGYIKALEQAKIMGQQALAEKLIDMIEVVRSESQLFALNLKQYITEEQIIEFYKKSEKGLNLLWIKNFSRIIPSEFIEIKRKLDELGVFDNYTILTYDPNGKTYAETKEEEDKRKDPIFFGVIKGSRKLYYIGDWVDDYCDLTLENFIDEFGKKAISQNNITAKINLKDI